MWRYIVRRLLWVVVVVLVVTAITYVVFFVMPSSDPAVTFAGKNPTPEQIEEVRHQFGFDKPVPIQYLTFMKHIFFGDQYGWPGLGFSTRPARRSMTSSSTGSWAPSSCHRRRPGLAGHRHPHRDRLGGQTPHPHRPPGHGLRPVLRVRPGVLAGADGGDPHRPDLGALLGGAVITETVFNLQGVGQWAVASVFQSDLPVVLAVTVVVAIAVTMMNLIMDIVYAYLDPRVRYN
jgi:ABC-type dipeptide/oligopeptide/nickel transport system permease component